MYDAYQHHGWKESGRCNSLTAGQNQAIRGDTPLAVEDGDGNDIHHDNGNDPED